MVYGGVSIQGKYHGVNQDSWLCREYGENACIMVVSDGLGSKKYSGQGSEAICESVFEVISTLKIDMNMVSFRDIIAMCHQRWKKKLTDLDYDIRQCCATMLVLVVTGDRVKAARLGDGFVAVCTENGIRVLFDEKEDCFANETDCLREELDREKIEILDLLLTHFDDGRRKIFLYTAVNLLELPELRRIVRQLTKEPMWKQPPLKERAACAAELLRESAERQNLQLKLRKKK